MGDYIPQGVKAKIEALDNAYVNGTRGIGFTGASRGNPARIHAVGKEIPVCEVAVVDEKAREKLQKSLSRRARSNLEDFDARDFFPEFNPSSGDKVRDSQTYGLVIVPTGTQSVKLFHDPNDVSEKIVKTGAFAADNEIYLTTLAKAWKDLKDKRKGAFVGKEAGEYWINPSDSVWTAFSAGDEAVVLPRKIVPEGISTGDIVTVVGETEEENLISLEKEVLIPMPETVDAISDVGEKTILFKDPSKEVYKGLGTIGIWYEKLPRSEMFTVTPAGSSGPASRRGST